MHTDNAAAVSLINHLQQAVIAAVDLGAGIVTVQESVTCCCYKPGWISRGDSS